MDYRWYHTNRTIVRSYGNAADGIARPLPDGWVELTESRGDTTVTFFFITDFSIQVRVTDTRGDISKDFHSVRVGEVQHADTDLPETVTLSENYPNPSNPSTTISFGLPENQHVKLAIYSLAGKRITTLVKSTFAAGYHTVQWNATNAQGVEVSSGVYIYRLVTSWKTITKRLTVMK